MRTPPTAARVRALPAKSGRSIRMDVRPVIDFVLKNIGIFARLYRRVSTQTTTTHMPGYEGHMYVRVKAELAASSNARFLSPFLPKTIVSAWKPLREEARPGTPPLYTDEQPAKEHTTAEIALEFKQAGVRNLLGEYLKGLLQGDPIKEVVEESGYLPARLFSYLNPPRDGWEAINI